MKFLYRSLPFLGLLPSVAFAQGELTGVSQFINNIISFMNNTLVPLVFAVAFLVFIFGIFNYFIFGAHDEGKRETGRTYMLYGIIGFVLMVSVWGIVNLIANGLGFTGDSINLPTTPGVR